MKALDKQAWAAAYNSKFLGFQQQEVFKVVRPEPGVKIQDMLTSLTLEYTENNGGFLKCKARLCTRGELLHDRQILDSACKNLISLLLF